MEHRCVVRVRGPNLTDTITGTDPFRDDKPLITCAPTIDTPDARFTSNLVNILSERIYDILVDHPINKARGAEGKNIANIVLLRGCGRHIDVPSIEKLHGFKSFMIAPTPVIAGLGITFGMDLIKVDGATGGYDTDLIAKGRKAVELLKSTDYTMGFIHIKAVDEAGHDKNAELKVKYIEKSDEMIGYAIKEFQKNLLFENTDYTIVLTGDHTTPVYLGQHSHEPVPFTISSITHRVPLLPDSVDKFDERSAAQGKLGRICGGEVMGHVKRFMNLKN